MGKKKKQETNSDIKISEYDRMMALCRMPEYIQDYASVVQGDGTIFYDDLCKKYDIRIPIPPEIVSKYKYQKPRDTSILDNSVQVLKNPSALPHREKDIVTKEGTMLCPVDLVIEEGKYINIKIDLTADRTQIKKNILEVIEAYQWLVKPEDKKKQRNREESDSIWEIYDKAKTMLIPEIARNMAGNKERDIVNARDKQVRRALFKAEGIINKIRTAIKNKQSL